MNKKPKTQDELLKSWGDKTDPLVSICCITFNHESFIAEALDGMLMQETGFTFEILIHDDASTDKTAEIIKEYEKEYPQIFRPIYQTENQYSQRKGASMNPEFNYPRARGKYIAVCEGDDYWTDPEKLQRQVGFLKSHPEYPAVAENSLVVNEDGVYLRIFSKIQTPEEYGVGDLIHGRKFHLASILFRTEAMNLPDNFKDFPFGDTLLFICLAKRYPIRFQPKTSSAYRKNAGGVTSMKNRKKWVERAEKFHLMINDLLQGQYSNISFQNIKDQYFSLFKQSVKKGEIGDALFSLKKIEAYWRKIKQLK